MTEILMSIRPEWCRLIERGIKTVEVRKTEPKGFTPYKVYIYCCKEKQRLIDIIKDGEEIYGDIYHGGPIFIKTTESQYMPGWQQGYVIGDFVCHAIEHLNNLFEGEPPYHLPENGESCLTMEQLEEYGEHGKKRLYGWKIDELNMYPAEKCRPLSAYGFKRPPQSWCYVRREDA